MGTQDFSFHFISFHFSWFGHKANIYLSCNIRSLDKGYNLLFPFIYNNYYLHNKNVFKSINFNKKWVNIEAPYNFQFFGAIFLGMCVYLGANRSNVTPGIFVLRRFTVFLMEGFWLCQFCFSSPFIWEKLCFGTGGIVVLLLWVLTLHFIKFGPPVHDLPVLFFDHL